MSYEDDLVRKIREAFGDKVKATGVYHINVIHDDWCDLLADKGPCNCTPVVQNVEADEEYKRRN